MKLEFVQMVSSHNLIAMIVTIECIRRKSLDNLKDLSDKFQFTKDCSCLPVSYEIGGICGKSFHFEELIE